MPVGQYTVDDLQQAPPPGQFTSADLGTKAPENGWEAKAKHMAQGLWNAAEMSAAAPAVAYEMYKKFTGQPNQLSEMPGRAALTFAATPEGEAGIATQSESAASKSANLLEHPAVTPWIDAAKAEAMKIPGANLAKTLYKSVKGLGETEAPAAATPPLVPSTNGVPWGTGGQGPLELRGKPIPSADPAAALGKPVGKFTVADIEPPPVTKQAVSSAVNDALDVQPVQIKPGMPIRSQITPRSANPTAGLPAGHTAVDSSALSSFKYDQAANELHVATNNNPSTVYVYGDVSADQAKAFADADSKGKAWAEFKQGSSPLVAKIVNGKRIAVKPLITLPPGTSESDLTPALQESLKRIRAAQ